MNKKRFLLIPAGLLFFIMLIYTSSDYDDSRFLFVIRNILIFLFFTSFILLAMIIIKDAFLKRNNKDRKTAGVIQVAVGLFGIMTLLLVGQIQYSILKIYEIPDLVACDLYDKYGNLLYVSKTASCPEILEEIKTYDTDSTLVLEVYESEGSKLFYEYYTKIVVQYRGFDIVESIVSTHLTLLNGSPANLQRRETLVSLNSDSIIITTTEYFALMPSTDSASYYDFVFDEFGYQTIATLTLGIVDDDSVDFVVTKATHYPDSVHDSESTILSGTNSFKIYSDYSIINSGVATTVSYNPSSIDIDFTSDWSTVMIGQYDYSNERLSGFTRYVNIQESLINRVDITFAEYIEVNDVADLYNYDIQQSSELKYDIDTTTHLLVEKKYSLDRSPKISETEQYFLDRTTVYYPNYVNMLTDFSDYEYYAIKRCNPLMDYIVEVLEGNHD